MTVTIKDYIPKYIKQTLIDPERTKVTHTRWNELWNLNIAQGDYHAEVLDLVCKALEDNYLKKSNAEVFTPSGDYEPATKKYVDDAVISAGGYNDEQAQDAVGAILTDTDSINFTYNDLESLLSAEVNVDEDTLVVDTTNHCLKVGPSVWTADNDGINSGLDADLVRGRNLIGEFDRLSYDNYLRTLELYYTGHFSGTDIAGMKGMTFDGFQDLSRVDTVASSAKVSNVHKLVGLNHNGVITEMRPVAIQHISTFEIPYPTGSSYPVADAFNNPANIIDTDPTTGSVFSYGYTYSNFLLTYQFDLGLTKFISGYKALGVRDSNGYFSLMGNAEISLDGVTWVPVSGVLSQTYGFHSTSVPEWIECTLAAPINARYIRLIFDAHGGGKNNVNYILYDLFVKITTPVSGQILQSSKKSLTDAVSFVKLYMSVAEPGGSSVVPVISADQGVNFSAMTLESFRLDPLNPFFTEKCYITNIAHPGAYMTLKATLNSNGMNAPIISRYGLHWA